MCDSTPNGNPNELQLDEIMTSQRIYHSPPHLSGRELEYLKNVIDTNWVAPVGPHLAEFEKIFCDCIGVKHALAVTTGTAAIHLALRHLDLHAGDEVICSSFTFCASANPITYEHAVPVFIDSGRSSWNMHPNLLEEELAECAQQGNAPKAIVVVDILGQSADMASIMEIAARYDVPVIEDAAEALGGTYQGKPIGSGAWCSTFSFNGNKIITTSGGGMLCSDDENLVERSRFLATQARDPAPHYEHTKIGFNYRLSNVLAALGIAQMEVLDQRVQRRKEIFQFYQDSFADVPGIRMMPIAPYGEPNYWLSVVQIDSAQFGAAPNDIRLALEEENIESRLVWKPLHCQPVFAHCRTRGGAVAEDLFRTGLCLPSGTAMTDEDLDRIVNSVRSVGT